MAQYTYSSQVAEQQKALNAKGANLKVDGLLGPLTQAAMSKYGGNQPQTLTQGQSFTDPAGRTGIVNYDANTGQPLAKGATTPSIGGQMAAIPKLQNTAAAPAIAAPDLEAQYKALLGMSPEEKKLQDEAVGLDSVLNNFNKSADQTNLDLEGQPIARGFISGQQAAVAKQAGIDRQGILGQQETLQQKLANAQQRRMASLDAVKFGLERADKAKEFSADDAYRNAVLNKKDTPANAGFTLNEGDKRFDANGNLIASGGPRTFAPSSGGTGLNNQVIDNERALMTQFRNEPIVKDYNEILGQKGTIDAYIKNGVGGPADLAMVFSFMKGLDPTSVVRETEYANAAKSGNLFQGVWAKFNGYFKEKGGILPPNVRKEFQNLVNQRLAVKEKQYGNLKSQYEGIASRQGLSTKNVVLDYQSGGGSTGTPQAQGSFNDPAWLADYNYDRDIKFAQDAISRGADKNTVQQALQKKYKEVNL